MERLYLSTMKLAKATCWIGHWLWQGNGGYILLRPHLREPAAGPGQVFCHITARGAGGGQPRDMPLPRQC